MGRPTYENKKTMKREEAVLNYLKSVKSGYHYAKLPRSFEIDYAAFTDEGVMDGTYRGLERLVEIKTYTKTKEYLENSSLPQDYFIASHKVKKLCDEADFMDVPPRLVAAFECGSIGFLDYEALCNHVDVGYLGRSDRNDPADHELCHTYNFDQFTFIR